LLGKKRALVLLKSGKLRGLNQLNDREIARSPNWRLR